MDVRDYVLAVLNSTNEVPGRTMVQKLVYLLSRRRQEEAPFRPHFYGPYSDEVQATLEALVRRGLVKESLAVYEPWEPNSFDVYQYSYRITPPGRQEANAIEPGLRADAQALVERAKALHAWNQVALATAAKIAHLHDLEPEATIDDLGAIAADFGWSIDHQSAAHGARLLSELER